MPPPAPAPSECPPCWLRWRTCAPLQRFGERQCGRGYRWAGACGAWRAPMRMFGADRRSGRTEEARRGGRVGHAQRVDGRFLGRAQVLADAAMQAGAAEQRDQRERRRDHLGRVEVQRHPPARAPARGRARTPMLHACRGHRSSRGEVLVRVRCRASVCYSSCGCNTADDRSSPCSASVFGERLCYTKPH